MAAAAAAVAPQPPPMAYHPQSGGDRFNPAAAVLSGTKARAVDSPFSSASSSQQVPSPHSTGPSLDTHTHHLGMAMSEKSSSFSSTSSGPTSPASMSYSPAVQSALRESCRSSTSSHQSALASAQQFNSKGEKRDLERQSTPVREHRPAVGSDRTTSAHYHASSYGLPDMEDEEEDLKAEDKAVRILLYLSGPNCLVSIVILLYTFLALFATILLQPFRFCTSSTSFRHQIVGFLAPTLRIQLNFICSPYSSNEFSAPLLVLVNLLSPLISLGVVGSAWVAAAFWFFNAILGDPDGSDKPKGYNDGRASVMGVRRWWEKWLRRPLR